MSGVFENTLCSTPYQGDYLATASATADELDIASKAALIEREGLRFDGTAGVIQNFPAIGASEYTESLLFRVPAVNPSNNCCIAAISSSSVNWFSGTFISLVLTYTGNLQCVIGDLVNNVVYVISDFVASYSGQIVNITFGRFGIYVNGTLFSTPIVNGSGSINASIASAFHFLDFGDALILPATITRDSCFNYALTQSEITALIGRGLVTLPEQRGGSMTALNTTTWSASSATQTVNTATAQTFSATGGFGYVFLGHTVLIKARKYKFSVTHTGVASGFSLSILESAPSYGNNQASFSVPTAAGTYSFEYASVAQSTSLEFRIQSAAGSGVSGAFTAISIIPLGTLFEQDSGQRNAGYMVRDTSGNNADLILPASGVSVIDPAMRGMIRFTTNTSGNQQIGGTQVIIPTNARISSWVINSSGTPNVTLGNVSAGAQYRASAAVVSGNNQITLLTPFTSTGNLWVNSSTTATLKHTIHWEYIQA